LTPEPPFGGSFFVCVKDRVCWHTLCVNLTAPRGRCIRGRLTGTSYLSPASVACVRMVTRAYRFVSSRVMSTRTDSQASAAKGTTVSFGEHFAASDQFDAISKEGMGLVEKTAAYLDGPGR